MPKILDIPDTIRPYTFHGADLSAVSSTEYRGDCPFCSKPKFHVGVLDGGWSCFPCGDSGNATKFIQKLWEHGTVEGLSALSRDRGISVAALTEWGVRRSLLTGEWLIPAYTPNKKLMNLYRYAGGRLVMPTATMGHQLFGAHLYDDSCKTLYVAEGPWDGMILWETLAGTKKTKTGYAPTQGVKGSLLAGCSVVAVAGANAWAPPWDQLCAGKDVVLLYDNDHPRTDEKSGRVSPGAGIAGVKRVSQLLRDDRTPPKSVSYLSWSDLDGEEYSSSLKSGYDVRDWLTKGSDSVGKSVQLGALLKKIVRVPDEWTVKKELVHAVVAKGCTSWRALTQQWAKALFWDEGLDRGLSVMLASACSPQVSEDQLWIKIFGPPSSGKTTLAEAIACAKSRIVSRDSITTLFSGYQTDKDATRDHSLAVMLRDTCLIIKDADTILQHPALFKLLSQFRGLYDRAFRSQFGNESSRDYEDMNVNVIFCGTSSMRLLNNSELGERFLDCVIAEELGVEKEGHINRRNFGSMRAGFRQSPLVNGTGAVSPDMREAQSLTAGYVEYLCENVGRLISGFEMPDSAADQINDCALYVAYMRARPSPKQDEDVQREMSPRLFKQLTKLAVMLAVVLNRKSLDAEVMRRVRLVAKDTARGRTQKICEALYESIKDGEEGLDSMAVERRTNEPGEKQRVLLKFLARIGAVESHRVEGGGLRRVLWRLTPQMYTLYERVAR